MKFVDIIYDLQIPGRGDSAFVRSKQVTWPTMGMENGGRVRVDKPYRYR